MESIEKKLVLERDITRLETTVKQLGEKIEKLEAEQLDLVDLKTKAQKEITELNEKKRALLNDISEEKSRWHIVQQAEKESLDRQDLDAKKILNREKYVATQEVQLSLKLEQLTKERNDVNEKERILKEGMDFLEREKKQMENEKIQQQKSVEGLKNKMAEMKEEFIRKVSEL